MNKKNKKWKEEYESIKSEILREKVSLALKENPNNWQESIEELGFIWIDDKTSDEHEEENNAIPENKNQEILVAYFSGEIKLNDKLVTIFISEVETEEPNYPLLRKYFKLANTHLLNLLNFGLNSQPTNQTLLSGIGYYHENNRILAQVIKRYTKACQQEQDLKKFKQLSIDFINNTYNQDYDALIELKSMFEYDSDRIDILAQISALMRTQNEEIIEF